MKWTGDKVFMVAFVALVVGLVAGTEPLAQLIAIADTDRIARLRLLRAIRDLRRPSS